MTNKTPHTESICSDCGYMSNCNTHEPACPRLKFGPVEQGSIKPVTPYTPEPWRTERNEDNLDIVGSNGTTIAMEDLGAIPDNFSSGTQEHIADVIVADFRRIVTCVNACRGIPTEALEGGVLRELVEILQDALDLKRIDNNAVSKDLEDALAKVEGRE